MVISGRVLDEARRPVAGAAVYVSVSPQALPDIAQLTDENGGFALAAPAAGQYVLGARSTDATGQVVVQIGTESVNVEIVLAQKAE